MLLPTHPEGRRGPPVTREPEGRRPGGVKNDVKPRPPERRRPQPSRSCEIGAEGFGYSVEYSSIISTRRPLSFTAEGALPLRAGAY